MRPAYAHLPLWQEWQDSNLQPPVLETGALPIELQPYERLGVRRRAALPRVSLSRFFVDGVMAAPGTVLLELDAVRIVLLVLVRVIVATLAFLASESHQLAHTVTLSQKAS